MDPSTRLRAQITSLEGVLVDLKTQLIDAEAYYNHIASAQIDSNGHSQTQPVSHPVNHDEKTFETLVDQLELAQGDKWTRSWELTSQEHKRYGRQLIMPEMGLRGGPSALKYTKRLSLTRIGDRTTAA